ncbi:MAG: flagellar basal-body rod protein FlgF [Deltaproteobacteria bacterium]|nr:flagellar basal-body rod protein FlgF [Deltaproteobacteria bacterium]
MSQTLYIAAAGARAQQVRLEVLANNLSNVNTVGFKEDKTVFKAFLLDPASGGEAGGDGETDKGPSLSGVLPSNVLVSLEGIKTNFTAGQMKYTGNALDLTVDGDGFFCVEGSDGVLYTRKGNFVLSQEGILVTQEGFPVSGRGGEIRIDGRQFVVDGEGNISVDGTLIDTIKVVDFPQPYSLEKIGDSFFRAVGSDIREEKPQNAAVMQGYVELSNVSPLKMMTEMMEVLRTYESFQKIIQSVDEATGKAINEVGRVA